MDPTLQTAKITSAAQYNGGPIEGFLKPLNSIVPSCPMGFRLALNQVPMRPIDASFSDSCTPERCSFCSPTSPLLEWRCICLLQYAQRNLFRICIKSTEIRLYLLFFRLIWKQTDVRLVRALKSLFDSFQFLSDTIDVTVFLLIINQTGVRLVHNQKKNCHCDYIPINYF